METLCSWDIRVSMCRILSRIHYNLSLHPHHCIQKKKVQPRNHHDGYKVHISHSNTAHRHYSAYSHKESSADSLSNYVTTWFKNCSAHLASSCTSASKPCM